MTWLTQHPSMLAIIIPALVLLGASIWIFRKLRRSTPTSALTSATRSSTTSTDAVTIFFVVVPIFLILGLGGILATKIFSSDPEIQLGFLVVIAIIALISLLFILAAGFSHLQLADPKQALGLPEGSIRSMIALILILVFIIFGIYLFRITGIGNESGPTQVTFAELIQLKNVSFFQPRPDGKFDVWVKSDLTADGVRIAQQLVTTVGTLVVAVAGFYFGSSSVTAAAAAVRQVTPIQPIIASIDPTEGKQSEEIGITISGHDFQMPRAVKLVRGAEEILATSVMASPSRITAKLKLDKDAGGDRWDIVVQSSDGAEIRREKAFRIDA